MRSGPALSETKGMGTYAEKKSAALAAKNTKVITYDELERIKSMCK